MSVRRVLKFPDPVLRQPTVEVAPDAFADGSLRALVTDMAETMYSLNGAGLAAIQIGSPLRLFIVEPTVAGRGENDAPMVFINPELLWLSDENETKDEGCLSFP